MRDKTDEYDIRMAAEKAGLSGDVAVAVARRESANTRQVGGSHYGGGERQHWDLMLDLDAGYFPAVITKYTERHPKKAGRVDLEKALHYAEKQHEDALRRAGVSSARGPSDVRLAIGMRLNPTVRQRELVWRYCDEKKLDFWQSAVFVAALLHRNDTGGLVALCRAHLEAAYPPASSDDASDRPQSATTASKSRPGTPEDGGQHAPRGWLYSPGSLCRRSYSGRGHDICVVLMLAGDELEPSYTIVRCGDAYIMTGVPQSQLSPTTQLGA